MPLSKTRELSSVFVWGRCRKIVRTTKDKRVTAFGRFKDCSDHPYGLAREIETTAAALRLLRISNPKWKWTLILAVYYLPRESLLWYINEPRQPCV